jgi:hypothetical protein
MFQHRTLRKLSYPYRYIKVSKQIAIRKPHKIHSNLKKVTLHCAPSIISEVLSETILFPVKTSTTEIIEHYIIGMCLNAITTTLVLKILYNDNDTDN